MLRGDKYEQSGGEQSVNIQGENVTYNGLSYRAAKEIALDVFDANFYRLSAIAREVAQERAEKIAVKFLKKLENDDPKSIEQVQDPDIQYALFTAQREYARSGDDNLGEMLVELLVERTKEIEKSLKQVVLNEAIVVLSKLNQNQIDLLSILFLIDNVNFTIVDSIDTFKAILHEYFNPLIPSEIPSRNQFLHLEYCSCIVVERISSKDIIKPFINNYQGLFQKGFKLDEFTTQFPELNGNQKAQLLINYDNSNSIFHLNAINEEVLMTKAFNDLSLSENVLNRLKQFFSTNTLENPLISEKISLLCPKFTELEEIWRSTDLKSATLTTVGKAIAHANLIRSTNLNTDLEVWMK